MSNINIPSVTIEDFTRIIHLQLAERNFRPIFGLGLGGIGKSESIYELAKKLNIGYIDIRLLLYNETDLKGIPYPDANHIKTIWLQNNILPTVEKDGVMGILVFDEITSCNRSVRTAAYQLLNERKLGEYVLPDNWLVVCLGNGPEDGGDFNGMEGNFLNRCSVYNVIPSINTWCDWAVEHNLNPLVIGYIRFNNNDFHTYNVDDDLALFASPRSWKAVSDILNNNEDLSNYIQQLRIQGNVGTQVGQSFISFCKFKTKAINAEDILKGTAGYDIDNKEALMITLSSMTKLVGEELKNLSQQQIMDANAVKRVCNAINWLIDLKCNGSSELRLMTFKDITKLGSMTMLRIYQTNIFKETCVKFNEFSKEYTNIL